MKKEYIEPYVEEVFIPVQMLLLTSGTEVEIPTDEENDIIVNSPSLDEFFEDDVIDDYLD